MTTQSQSISISQFVIWGHFIHPVVMAVNMSWLFTCVLGPFMEMKTQPLTQSLTHVENQSMLELSPPLISFSVSLYFS